MRKGIAIASFTDRGQILASRLAEELGGEATRIGMGTGSTCIGREESAAAERPYERDKKQSLAVWTQEHFQTREALVYIGAAGIAVRAVAPHIRNKAEDPAVLCVDEQGKYVIPLLSGHLGGANALACKIADTIQGEAVITTATDLSGAFAVDVWAKAQGMTVLQPGRIRTVSARILRGEEISISSAFPITGEAPPLVKLLTAGRADVVVSYREAVCRRGIKTKEKLQPGQEPLQLVPRCLVLGVGCRRGTAHAAMEEAFLSFCHERGIQPQAVVAAATIDLKRNEEGLLAFCREHGWPLQFYSAEELRETEGRFSSSRFVEETTGVDNVCERAAVLCADGLIVEKKFTGVGITFALAQNRTEFDWRY